MFYRAIKMTGVLPKVSDLEVSEEDAGELS